MKESQCNTDAVRSLKHYGWGADKISDVMGSRFTAKKPCDIIACSPKGRYVAIESKLMKRWAKFSFDLLRPNQVEHLSKTALKRQGRAFVFLFVEIPRNPKTGEKRIYKLCVLDWVKYHKQIMSNSIGADDLKGQKVGKWFEPQKVNGKVIFPLKKLLC